MMQESVAPPFPIDGNACYALYRSRSDWAAVVKEWSPELDAIMMTMLLSPTGMCLCVGHNLCMFYNDGYSIALGSHHPSAMGRPIFDVFPEVRLMLQASYREILKGKNYVAKELLIPLNRGGLAEAYFTFSGSPIFGQGLKVLGAMFIVLEATAEVKSKRRSALLRELTEYGTSAIRGNAFVPSGTPYLESVSRSCGSVLEKNDKDFPFAAIYVRRGEDNAALTSVYGVETEQMRLFPALLAFGAHDPSDVWGVTAAMRGDRPSHTFEDVVRTHGVITKRPWDVPVSKARVYSLCLDATARPSAVVVLGMHPMTGTSDPDYDTFVQALLQCLTTTLAAAVVYDKGREQVKELQLLNEAKSSFVANVSHEFRTPLTLILSPLEDLLGSGDRVPREMIDMLTLVHRNAVRLLYMVNNLLEFTTSEAKGLTASFECINLPKFTAEIISQFEHAVRHARLTLLVNGFDAQDIDVYVDRAMWEKIVVNIIANAIKYTPVGGEISASFQVSSTTVQFVVADSGVGIAEESLPHIFERFYRVRQVAYTEGTGIGLALVKELVHAHGGSIHVRSTVGKGSTFSVELPLGTAHLNAAQIRDVPSKFKSLHSSGPSQLVKHASLMLSHVSINASLAAPAIPSSASVANSVASSSSSSSSSFSPSSTSAAPQATPLPVRGPATATVLVVDDNDQMLQYVATVLSRSNANVYALRFARNGLKALASIQAEGKPDLVLSDVMMPEMDGIDFIRHVRSDPQMADLPVILMSARGTEQSRLSGIAEGADDYIVKPFSSAELLTRVKSLIELTRTRRVLAVEVEASRAKDQFIAVLSHELRNPLSAVLLSAEMLATEPSTPVAVQENAMMIRSSIQLEVALIDDLLDCAQVACGSLRLRPTPTNVHALLRRVVTQSHAELVAKGLRVVESLSAQRATGLADDARLLQVLGRLLQNAIKFSHTGAEIFISTTNSAEEVVIEVRDTGYGIAPELLPRIFERFISADPKHKAIAAGLGCSLFLSRSLLRLMNGSISAASDGEGRGSTFTVRVPVSQELRNSGAHAKRPRGDATTSDLTLSSSAPPVLEGSESSPKLRACAHHSPSPFSSTASPAFEGLRVLVVEDNRTTLHIMRRLLSEVLRCDVSSAESVKEGLEASRARPIDVVLSDIGLPDGNGWELMQQLRKERPMLCGIAISGYSTDDDLERSRSAGFIKHITKPIGLVALRNALVEATSALRSLSLG